MSENNQTLSSDKSKESKRGGARKGAGRKAGSANVRTREIADKAASEGITPLEVMLEAMNHFRAEGDMQKAALFARDAAPYIHPKLASVEMSGKDGGDIGIVGRIELVPMNGNR